MGTTMKMLLDAAARWFFLVFPFFLKCCIDYFIDQVHGREKITTHEQQACQENPVLKMPKKKV